MHAGIIAAGWGQRLGGGPKALVPVAGRALIDHVLDGLQAAGVDHVTCIVNEASKAVVGAVASRGRGLEFDWIVETTPSSMHSFLVVLERLSRSGEPWHLMTTVDAICPPETVRSFADRAARLPDADVVLALTDLVDDEKPLYAALKGPVSAHALGPASDVQPEAFRIRALGADAAGSAHVTAGLYRVSPSILRERQVALDRGYGALRQFLGHLLASGYGVYGLPIPPAVDVDRPADVGTAERFLREWSRR